jgi:hypothetical protein
MCKKVSYFITSPVDHYPNVLLSYGCVLMFKIGEYNNTTVVSATLYPTPFEGVDVETIHVDNSYQLKWPTKYIDIDNVYWTPLDDRLANQLGLAIGK